MQVNQKEKRRVGRLSRLAMMFAGREGIRRADVEHFKANMEAIVTAWSRLNLEGRSQTWAPRNVLPSIFVKRELEYGDEQRWTAELNALWEAVIWKRV
jgi:hypothetical protein